MKIGIMQPYFFPYLGYWQLIRSVDVFIAFDDVNYIKRGWINRNRILMNAQPAYLTIPVVSASQNKKINELKVMEGEDWREKMLKTLQHAYSKAPFFNETYELIQSVIFNRATGLNEFLLFQLEMVSRYLEMDVEIKFSSANFPNTHLKGVDRIIDICKLAGASTYINPPGARDMYEHETFMDHELQLRILVPQLQTYPQRHGGFEPNLSIIDALMEIGKDGVMQQLDAYALEEQSQGGRNE